MSLCLVNQQKAFIVFGFLKLHGHVNLFKIFSYIFSSLALWSVSTTVLLLESYFSATEAALKMLSVVTFKPLFMKGSIGCITMFFASVILWTIVIFSQVGEKFEQIFRFDIYAMPNVYKKYVGFIRHVLCIFASCFCRKELFVTAKFSLGL